jgi:hypothetical protein
VKWATVDILGDDGNPLSESLQPNGVPPIDWQTAGFHDVMGKFFVRPVAVQNQHRAVVYERALPVDNGRFRASNFKRYLTDANQRYRLPYGVTTQTTTAAPGSSTGYGDGAAGYGAGRGAPAPSSSSSRGTPAPTSKIPAKAPAPASGRGAAAASRGGKK